ncbi:TonB-dependent receptor [Reichenbachiella agariperforans]|uniref:TonB-dependent receptor n=1 Tax=Reichenbachiella agariperforans TaxID=156994 RepID=UPI001C08A1BD|nr:TonB-dependent receptor [Reichenbachiella agariperforans]MBU2912797.1 TonB-dependent receptor [Reichenbachiella agariperforans]
MKHYLILLILIFVPCYIWAQSAGTLEIKVYSEGQPLAFASIGIKGTNRGGTTNTKGILRLTDLSYGSYDILVSIMGFKSEKVTVVHQASLSTLTVDLEESATALDEVVVSGTMTEISKMESAVSIDVYSPKFFKANPTPSVFESMQNINGVRPQINCNVCNTGDIHINGLEGPYTMVLIDGMPLVSGLSSVYGLTGIPQSLIERVEIVKGPASTLYGSEAVGGLINLITKTPENTPTVSTDAFATSWGEVNTDIGLKLNTGNKSHTLVGINYFYYQNPIDNNGDNFTDLTLQNRISLFNKWTMKRKNNRQLSLAGRYVYEDRWGGEMQWTPEDRGGDTVYGESIYTKRWETFGTYQLPVEEIINFQFSANGHKQDSYYGDLSFQAQQNIGFGQLTWHRPVGRHEFLLGAAYRYTYYNDNTVATTSPSITHLPGAYLQDDFRIDNQNKILLGVRYDYNSLHGGIWSPRINYKWNTTNKKNILRLSLGNGYRVANVFTEDHAALTGARDVVFEEELKPEESWNVNLNFVKKIITNHQNYIGVDASVFYTYFDNRIVPDYESDPNEIRYANLDGSAVSKGVSLNLDLSWHSGLSALVGTSIIDVSIEEEGVKRRQLLTEKVSGVWNIGYTFGASLISIDYTGNLYGPMRLPLLGPEDDRPAYSLWYSIQNIQITKKFINGLEIYGGIKNLLNFTPPANSIARAHDPFDENVNDPIDNPNNLTFDPSYVYAPNQGIRGFAGVRYALFK